MTGALYLVGTPIGNLGDITYRAVEILQQADFIAAEDTRHTRQLLNYLGIKKPLTSYYEHNKEEKTGYLLEELQAGKQIALVSDAGMPGICDPGMDLLNHAKAAGIPVTVVPGPCALITALVSSGIAAVPFTFEGFLEREKKTRQKQLEKLKQETRTMIFYETPHRLLAALKDMSACFGETREMAVTRELTKKFEEVKRGSVGEMVAYFAEKQTVKGEFCLVVRGAGEVDITPSFGDVDLLEMRKVLENQGMSRKAAARKVGEETGASVNYIYRLGLEEA